jgi:hypothetical protein
LAGGGEAGRWPEGNNVTRPEIAGTIRHPISSLEPARAGRVGIDARQQPAIPFSNSQMTACKNSVNQVGILGFEL